jgi:hypothetical protein
MMHVGVHRADGTVGALELAKPRDRELVKC